MARARADDQAASGLYVCTESVTFDRRGVPVYVHPGAVIRAGNQVMAGRERFFTPLVIQVEFDEGLPVSQVPVAIVGQAGDAGFQVVRVRIRSSAGVAGTPAYNLGS